MSRLLSIALLGSLLAAFIGQPTSHVSAAGLDPNTPDLVLTSEIEQDGSVTTLVLTAEISPGLHIYAQSQPKPFLAAKFDIVTQSPSVIALGEFVPTREPILVRHPQLGHELHEYEDQIQWRSELSLSDASSNISNVPIKVAGTLFAQACEEARCFPPQKYSFTATATRKLNAIPMSESEVASIETSQENSPAAFKLDDLQVENDEAQSALTVLPFAFIAGFLLNFMPCVLPVVGLKLLSFVQQAQSDRRRILLMNLAYTAGLVSVMMVLATLAVFAGFGWGEQFSSPAFTITLTGIVFAFGLSFLGVWEIPTPSFLGASSGNAKQEGYAGAFSKGILSTLLATPCSGPFLGAALAWAVTQPGYVTYGVFLAVGLGMASPYLVVGMFPSTIRFLPKPGNWMVTFKQVMGFIMLATVIYLISFMPVAAVVPTVLLLLGIGLAVWYAARTPGYAPAKKQVQAWAVAVGMIVITAGVSFGWLQDVMQERFERSAQRLLESRAGVDELIVKTGTESDHIQWQSYTPARLEQAIESGRPVFVDFTADWCLTCKSNEAAAVETAAVAQAIRESGAISLRADKTEPNPDADALLRKLGNSAASIPFYAVFSPDHPNAPVVMDGVYTAPEPFVKAIRQASASELSVQRENEFGGIASTKSTDRSESSPLESSNRF